MIIQLNEFIDYLRAERNYSGHTIINYKSDIEQFFDGANIKSTKEMSKQNIRSFLSRLASNNISASSRNRKLSSIRSFCKFLKKEGLIQENPTLDIENAKIERMLPVTFSIDIITNIINSAKSPRDKAILEVLYGLGVRVDELVNIKITDIEFNTKSIKVFGKGGKERMLPMNDSSIAAIVAFLQKRDIVSNWLIPSTIKSGSPISDRTVRNIVYKYGKMHGIENISPHKFRHSCATHMHQNGMDIRDVQEMLGHADISTTTIYTRVSLNSLTKSYHSAHPRG